MICTCGNRFEEVYHRDFPDLCLECAMKEIGELNDIFRAYYRSLTPEQRPAYFKSGPYTVKQVKDIILHPHWETLKEL